MSREQYETSFEPCRGFESQQGHNPGHNPRGACYRSACGWVVWRMRTLAEAPIPDHDMISDIIDMLHIWVMKLYDFLVSPVSGLKCIVLNHSRFVQRCRLDADPLLHVSVSQP